MYQCYVRGSVLQTAVPNYEVIMRREVHHKTPILTLTLLLNSWLTIVHVFVQATSWPRDLYNSVAGGYAVTSFYNLRPPFEGII